MMHSLYRWLGFSVLVALAVSLTFQDQFTGAFRAQSAERFCCTSDWSCLDKIVSFDEWSLCMNDIQGLPLSNCNDCQPGGGSGSKCGVLDANRGIYVDEFGDNTDGTGCPGEGGCDGTCAAGACECIGGPGDENMCDGPNMQGAACTPPQGCNRAMCDGGACMCQDSADSDGGGNDPPAPFCGDGEVNQSSEECDDGNNASEDGCDPSCLKEVEPVCGDGEINQSNEECDDGNTDDNDGCNTSCLDEFCGDSVVQTNEECDDGNTDDNDGCSGNCIEEFCGDDVTQASEECDDGNDKNNDDCTNDCNDPICGDGFINQSSEECDGGEVCLDNCTLPQCSDGKDNDGDGAEDCEDLGCLCGECYLEGEKVCEPWRDDEYDQCSDPDWFPRWDNGTPLAFESSLSDVLTAQLIAQDTMLDEKGPGGGDITEFAESVLELCAKQGGMWHGKNSVKVKDGIGTVIACVGRCYCEDFINEQGRYGEVNAKKRKLVDGYCTYDKIKCVKPDPERTEWENWNSNRVICDADCHELFSTLEAVERCKAQCICACNGQDAPNPLGAVTISATDAQKANGKKAFDCYNICERDEKKPPDICRSECIEAQCPAPPRDPTPTRDRTVRPAAGAPPRRDVGAPIFPNGGDNADNQNNNVAAAPQVVAPDTSSGSDVASGSSLSASGSSVSSSDISESSSSESSSESSSDSSSEVAQSSEGSEEFSSSSIFISSSALSLTLSVPSSTSDIDDDDDTNIVVRINQIPNIFDVVTHTECFEDQCLELEGIGDDECSVALDCGVGTHLECRDNACTEVPGDGGNECSDDIECNEHSVCDNQACVIVAGAGDNECLRVRDCFFRNEEPTQVLSEQIIRVLDDQPPEATCGNGITEPPEDCDDGNRTNGDGCSNLCTQELPLESFCGNGFVERGEGCDDGNIFPGDGCNLCKTEFVPRTLVAAASFCGNGLLEGNEECDDSNRRDSDGCDATCLLEIGICGDGVVQSLLGEQCEQLTHGIALPFGCVGCLFFSRTCGDGKLDPGEECDDGPRNSNSPNALCRSNCHGSRCGDGTVDSNELCDDGNKLGGDGCNRFCREESTQIAFEQEVQVAAEATFNAQSKIPNQLPGMPFAQPNQFGFPQYPNFQQLPYQLPLAQLQPLIALQGPVGDTGPASVAVIGAGAAAGFSWIRRRRK